MGIQAIKLNLAPHPTPWRLHHRAISWVAFAIGATGLALAIFFTVRAYREADRAGQKAVAITDQARAAQRQQAEVLNELREIKVDAEMPRWRLAERILMERALPWSRVTAELERSLVQDVRIKSIQRSRGTDQGVELKVRGESRSQKAEEEFIESLHKNFAFAQVLLEREAEMSNRRGSLEFDYNLHLNTDPPPYELLPKYGPERKPDQETPPPEPPKEEKKPPVQQPTPQVQPPSQRGSARETPGRTPSRTPPRRRGGAERERLL